MLPFRTNLPRTAAAATTRVWDLPLRLFHWSLVACFATAWLATGDRTLDVHVLAGYLLSGLLAFRLLWGFVGERHARFGAMRFSCGEVRDYLRGLTAGRAARFTGHNPAASWAIWMMLFALSLLVGSGLLTLGGEERQGPLAGWLSIAQGVWMHQAHRSLAWLMLALVAVHLGGVLVESLVHRENLVGAMFSGRKRGSEALIPVARRGRSAAALLIVMLLFTLGWFRPWIMQSPEQPYLPFVVAALPDDPLWREECGACHLAFHPSLLPARSWQRLMDEQAAHFGEDLALDVERATRIGEFLLRNGAERSDTEAAWKINAGIPPGSAPLRITDTAYWQAKHAWIGTGVWAQANVNGKSNCAACHFDAEQGAFQDAAMRVPPPAAQVR